MNERTGFLLEVDTERSCVNICNRSDGSVVATFTDYVAAMNWLSRPLTLAEGWTSDSGEAA